MTEEIIYLDHEKKLPFVITITGTSYCDGSYHIKRSRSEVITIEYIVSGSGVVMCDGKTYYPNTGDMYVLPVGSDHEYYSYSEDPWEKIWFNAKGELAGEILNMYGIGRRFYYEGVCGEEYIREIHRICKDGNLSAEEMHNRSAVVMLKLAQFLAEESKDRERISDAERIKDYIDENISSDIGIENIADAIGLSVSQTIRKFRHEYSITPYEYLIGRRIERAKFMLKSTNLKIKDIALAVSYCDEHYFSGVFKKRTGCTPGEYRRL